MVRLKQFGWLDKRLINIPDEPLVVLVSSCVVTFTNYHQLERRVFSQDIHREILP